MEYVADEVSALRSLLLKIDIQVLTESPIDGGRSIVEQFVHMVQGQRNILAMLSGDQSDGADDAAPPVEDSEQLDSLLSIFLRERQQLLEFVEDGIVANADDRSDETMTTLLYDLVIDESDALRGVAIRLHESNLFRF